MKNIFLFFFSLLITLLAIAGCDSQNSIDNPITVSPQKDNSVSNGDDILSKCGRNTTLRRQLIKVKSATAKYHSIKKADKDGYKDIDVIIPHMGWHYLKKDLLDDTFDFEKPELLVYAPDRHGMLRLVAVEYAIPGDENTVPPEAFAGSDDVWDYADGLWTLHTWIWYYNPDGIFAPFNPRVNFTLN